MRPLTGSKLGVHCIHELVLQKNMYSNIQNVEITKLNKVHPCSTLHNKLSQEMAYGIEGGGVPLYFFYDCETTGLKIGYDGIIEIAAVVYTKNLRRRVHHPELHSLCYTDRELTPEAKRLTGLTNRDLEGQPRLKDVLHNFFDWIRETVQEVSERERGNYVPVLAAHSGPRLDFPMLFKAVERIGARNRSLQRKFDTLNLHYADTFSVFKKLQSTRMYGPQLQKLGAHDIYLAYFPPSAHAHRALDDAKSLCKIFSESCPAAVFMEKLETYIQSKDGLDFTREQICKFLQIKCGDENFFKVFEVIDLLHKDITFEDLENEYRRSERHLRRFLAEECGFTDRE